MATKIIDTKEIEVVTDILNHVIATMEPDPQLDLYTSNDALLIVLNKEQYETFKRAMKKLND